MCRRGYAVNGMEWSTGANIACQTIQIKGPCPGDTDRECAGGRAEAYRGNRDTYGLTIKVKCFK